MKQKISEKTPDRLPDKKSLSILAKYDLLHPENTSSSDFEYAKENGFMFDPVIERHDNTIESLFREYAKCNKRHIIDLFIASLSTNRLEWRIAFPVYAILQTFPKHSFEPSGHGILEKQCKVCSSLAEKKVDLSFINYVRFFAGGIIEYSVFHYNFCLRQHNLLPQVIPTESDFKILAEMFDLILNADLKETPSTLQKKIRLIKGFKSTEEQRRVLIDGLGFCSILETDQDKGFLTHYTNLGVAPRKSRSSDWRYPVDWWTGKDGLNKAALKFWFGDYRALDKYF